MDKPCSRCKGPRDRETQRYCRPCHAAYMRDHRPKHTGLATEARKKANARAYANTYKRRGLLAPGACFICEAVDAEMHHDDYSKPLDVLWLCRPCHLEHHRNVAKARA